MVQTFVKNLPVLQGSTVMVTVTVGAYFTYKDLCSNQNDRNTTPAGTGDGARIQSETTTHTSRNRNRNLQAPYTGLLRMLPPRPRPRSAHAN
jgi:hypothetical protein